MGNLRARYRRLFGCRRFGVAPFHAAAWLLTLLCLGGCQPRAVEATNQLNLIVTDAGLYQVSRSALAQAGLLVTDWSMVQLTEQGKGVPFFVENDALYFWGKASTSRYTAVRPYQLTNQQPGQLMSEQEMGVGVAEETAVLFTHTVAPNHLYESRAVNSFAEPWFWHQLTAGETATFPLALPYDPVGEQTLTLRFWGLSDLPDQSSDHDLSIWIDGDWVGTAVWDGRIAYTASYPLSANRWARQHIPILTLQNDGIPLVDVILFDSWTVTGRGQPHIEEAVVPFQPTSGSLPTPLATAGFWLDLTQPTQPIRLRPSQNSSAWAPEATIVFVPQTAVLTPQLTPTSPHLSPATAEMVIIGADESIAQAVSPLVEARRQAGISVEVVTAVSIADTYGYGALTPTAIRHYLTASYKSHTLPRLRYLLLIGDGTLDPRGYANEIPPALLPAPFVPVTYGGETVSDAQLADINNDGRVDVAVGRWPVRSATEVARLVEQTMAFETAVMSTALQPLVDPSEPYFQLMSDRLGLVAQDENVPLGIVYLGHGSLQQMGNQLSIDELGAPLWFQLTCLTGLFAHPTTPALAEIQLLETESVGIVAATSLTLSQFQEPFAEVLLTAVSSPQPTRLGDALLAAQSSLDISQTGLREIHDTFLLLGDPTLPLPGGLHPRDDSNSSRVIPNSNSSQN